MHPHLLESKCMKIKYFLFRRGCAQCAPSSIYLWSHIKGTWCSLLCLYQPTSFVEHQHEAFCRFCLCCDYLSFIYGSKCKLNFRFSITNIEVNTLGAGVELTSTFRLFHMRWLFWFLDQHWIQKHLWILLHKLAVWGG